MPPLRKKVKGQDVFTAARLFAGEWQGRGNGRLLREAHRCTIRSVESSSSSCQVALDGHRGHFVGGVVVLLGIFCVGGISWRSGVRVCACLPATEKKDEGRDKQLKI